MLDLAVLVKAATFGGRNCDKVVNGSSGVDDKGRIAATAGQITSAGKAAAQLDNALGKGAQAAINVMGKAADESKILKYAVKSADWASKHVNPLLVGAAGYRVLTADDKEIQFKKEIFGMSAMFGIEALMKEFLNGKYMNAVHSKMKNKYAKAALAVIEGLGFVIGSVTGSNAGYKFGEMYLEKIDHKKLAKKDKESDLYTVKNEIEKLNNKIDNKFVDEDGLSAQDLGSSLVKKEVLA